jgi:glycerol-3-phosphate dehydrogenase (NAD(P)+)
MTLKDFWLNSKVGVIGGGSWGTVLANMVSRNCREVRLWVRDEASVRMINTTRVNQQYLPQMQLNEKVLAYSSLERIFEGGLNVVIWALPSEICRDKARLLAPFFRGDELLIHATKGIEPGSLKRISEILTEELPTRRIGVISGPNLAHEIARGEPAATVIASMFSEVREAGSRLFTYDRFRIYQETDVIGVEWAGTLKNILAIAAGALDAMKLGWSARAMLITRGLAEIVRFGTTMGAKQSTFLGLAGVGDLLATCSSPLSRNYRVGQRLAQGEKLDSILKEVGSTAEGVRTTKTVWEFASEHGISMPITEGVYELLGGGVAVPDILHHLIMKPRSNEI